MTWNVLRNNLRPGMIFVDDADDNAPGVVIAVTDKFYTFLSAEAGTIDMIKREHVDNDLERPYNVVDSSDGLVLKPSRCQICQKVMYQTSSHFCKP